MKLMRYRLFLKNGGYAVCGGHSRFEALKRYGELGKNPKLVMGICLIRGSGVQRMYKVVDGELL